MADKPVIREEKYLAYLTGDYTGELPKPITRKEKYLYELCLKGIGGEVSPEEIKSAVNEYLEKNPVKPGANTEQAQQIEQNKTDIASLKTETSSLKEDISTKITKFYASNQGETHITDSDNGKIMDMMVYGKSEQFTTTGKNLFPTITEKNLTLSNKEGTGTRYVYVFKMEQPFVITANKSPKANLYIATFDWNTKIYSNNFLIRNVSNTINNTVKKGAGTYCVFAANDDLESAISMNNAEIQIEKGSEATAYEPYTGGQPSPSPDYPQEIKSVVNPSVKLSNEDGTQFKTVTLPYTLNAIPVSSGGNVTIDGQQYIADYVDVERGKLVRMVGVTDQDTFTTFEWSDTGAIVICSQIPNVSSEIAIVTISSKFASEWIAGDEIHHFTQLIGQTLVIVLPKTITTVEQGEEIRAKGFEVYYILETPIEIDLSPEEIAAFKALTTYYPTTNISVNSEQLDGYTVFNYPISMQNGWNYVKQQLNDNRDYIYDMDLQSAEAYVNSEYAVALTELEV